MRVIREIDRGGFGRVEEVELDDGTRVARKTLDPRIDLDNEDYSKLRRRFGREVKVQSSLPTHIVLPVLDANLGADSPWYTMPLADRNYKVQLSEDREAGTITLGPLADLLNALEELHDLGFVHRDLKPENLLLHEGKWKLSDFGFVMPQSEAASRWTSTSSAWGTQAYMAPEQLTGFKDVTFAADIYSVGCIIHDLASGEPRLPFARHSCDGPLAPIVEMATETDPVRRFGSVSALRDALHTALSEPPSSFGPQAGEWADRLAAVSEWGSDELRDFARFLDQTDVHSDDASLICLELDVETMESLHKMDPQSWSVVADFYINWTDGAFEFTYCDVISARLIKILTLGEAKQKAAAILALARLGSSHNRWFVMRQLLAISGPKLDDSVAARVAIEIKVSETQDHFIACADGIGRPISEYHPRILQVLEEEAIPF